LRDRWPSDDAPADDIVTAGANPHEQAAWTAAWKGIHFAGMVVGARAAPHERRNMSVGRGEASLGDADSERAEGQAVSSPRGRNLAV
jgi:hypothetical protein